jgi:N-succinyldiaminopimelate aminotransferase
MSDRQPYLCARLQGFGTTIFTEMTRLAVTHGAVNLGQGFPDFDGPEAIKEAAIAAIRSGRNQYARMYGLPELNRAIVDHQRRFYGLAYDPESEVTVMAGATEAIFATLQAVCETGDEVVLFAPYYDSYRASVAMAGAVPRVIPLLPPDYAFDPAALEKAVTAKTRVVLVNTPHNPTGKVWSRDELAAVAEIARRHDLLVIADEVYEHLVYDGSHVALAALPGMRERTIVISSTGKTFSFTGWKIGYACAPPALSTAIRTAHQFVTFCNGTPFQVAMAAALVSGDEVFAELTTAYRARRDRFATALASAGFGVQSPAGTYFILADIRPLGFDDVDRFCRELPARVGVAAVPVTAFVEDPEPYRHLVRFAFCKTDATLDEAGRRLARLRPTVAGGGR